MAVLRFIFRRQFRESLAYPRKIKQGIVPEYALTLASAQKNALRCSAKRCQGLSIPRRRQNTYEPRLAPLGRRVLQFAQQLVVVGFIIGVTAWLIPLLV